MLVRFREHVRTCPASDFLLPARFAQSEHYKVMHHDLAGPYSVHPMAFKPETVPTDILYLLLEYLTDRRDLHSAALTSRSFNRAATPLLYRTLDTRTKWEDKEVGHLADRAAPRHYAAEETGIGPPCVVHSSHPTVTYTVLSSLALCENLYSFTWIDDNYSSGAVFISFLNALKKLPLRAITVRTYSDLGEPAWAALNSLTGLQKIAIWCMDGPPRVLQGWADLLGGTLTELELGRCAGVPASILISVLSKLPLLRELRLKGAPSAAIPDILTYLPSLVTLDTEFLGSGILRPADDPVPRLQSLTVRTSSVDLQGPQQLWVWLRQLIPYPSLETFTLNAFSTQGQTTIPRHFLLSLARIHGSTLRRFLVNMTQLTLEDVECLCTLFPQLQELSCGVASPDAASIEHAIAKSRNLHTLKLHVHWIPGDNYPGSYSPNSPSTRFTKVEAESLMLRSNIRVLSMGPHHYTGMWVRKVRESGKYDLVFEVVEDMIYDGWV
ncbi:hypothetical protein EVG20_g7312 [Dentipellis fragilis]|uniref:F-box domain-containing protein n=1 Tax=Dentipellis fragilis TaxID=205917 RepID=A0A4Y9YH24_9AGAM|nr:hypothetical protein EVG20_g7312 [Dentipellis fragilis]